MSKERKISINDMSVLVLDDTILSVSMSTRETMSDSMRSNIGEKITEFTATIKLKFFNFGLKVKFNVNFKFDESFKSL